MNSFDKIMGYESIKEELLQICDMMKNKDIYAKLGASLPKGVLLYGAPGLGKTLMAKCFIEECGLETFTLRKNKSQNFAEHISQTFEKAKQHAPSVVFLDDMDKFANEDRRHRDAEEYVAVQAGIDSVKGFDVIALATVNDFEKLPDSLTRAGRFDKCIQICLPRIDDCRKIIKHYLKGKRAAADVNLDDVAKMINYNSCAELETLINEAAVIAGYKRKPHIETEDITDAVLKAEYGAPDDTAAAESDTNLKRIAYHEAGHLVMSELLCPGCVGLASVRKSKGTTADGFVRQCKRMPAAADHILTSLAGKAATELVYGKCDTGCDIDIRQAADCIRKNISTIGSMGFGLVDVLNYEFSEYSQRMLSESEAVVHAELSRYMFKAKEILAKNGAFLKKSAELLLKKGVLLASDIEKLRERFGIADGDI